MQGMMYRSKVWTTLWCCFIFALLGIHTAVAQVYLYPIASEEKYGLIDAGGLERVAPRYQRAIQSGPSGLAPVQFEGKWGFVDSTGEWQIDAVYDEVFPFVNGRAIVRAGKLWGLVDTEGAEVISPSFLAVRTTDGNSYAVLNESHVRILGIKISTRREWGFVDPDGNWILEPFYLDALPFENGIGAVKLPRKALVINIGTTWAYVDTTGQYILEPGSRSARGFSEERAFTVRDGVASYIDTQGEVVFSTNADRAFDFSDSRARFFADMKWGFYGPQGEIAIAALYDHAQDFSEGVAAVKDGPLWGYIDTDGKWVIPPTYDRAWSFSGGRARAIIEGVTCYIDKSGSVIWSD
ncbi:MAG: WG repeat-containing protein [Bacteroidota bacterium]